MRRLRREETHLTRRRHRRNQRIRDRLPRHEIHTRRIRTNPTRPHRHETTRIRLRHRHIQRHRTHTRRRRHPRNTRHVHPQHIATRHLRLRHRTLPHEPGTRIEHPTRSNRLEGGNGRAPLGRESDVARCPLPAVDGDVIGDTLLDIGGDPAPQRARSDIVIAGEGGESGNRGSAVERKRGVEVRPFGAESDRSIRRRGESPPDRGVGADTAMSGLTALGGGIDAVADERRSQRHGERRGGVEGIVGRTIDRRRPVGTQSHRSRRTADTVDGEAIGHTGGEFGHECRGRPQRGAGRGHWFETGKCAALVDRHPDGGGRTGEIDRQFTVPGWFELPPHRVGGGFAVVRGFSRLRGCPHRGTAHRTTGGQRERPRVGEVVVERRWCRDDRGVEQQIRTRRLRTAQSRDPVRRRIVHEELVDRCRFPVRIRSEEHCGRSGNVGCRHGGAVVGRRGRGRGGNRRHHRHTGGEKVDTGPVVGETGDRIVAVRRSDRDGRRGARRRGLAGVGRTVAGGHRHHDAVGHQSGSGSVEGTTGPAAEAHVDHGGFAVIVVGHHPFEGVHDGQRAGRTRAAEHTHRHQRDLLRHSVDGPTDGAGHMGAVTVAVAGVGGVDASDEIATGGDSPGELDVIGPDPRIDDVRGDPLTAIGVGVATRERKGTLVDAIQPPDGTGLGAGHRHRLEHLDGAHLFDRGDLGIGGQRVGHLGRHRGGESFEHLFEHVGDRHIVDGGLEGVGGGTPGAFRHRLGVEAHDVLG